MRNTPNVLHGVHRWRLWFQGKAKHTSDHSDTGAAADGRGLKCVFGHANLRGERIISEFSPDGGFEFEELLRRLDDPGVVACQDAGAQEEPDVPVTLQLVQAALFTQKTAQLNSWKTTIYNKSYLCNKMFV